MQTSLIIPRDQLPEDIAWLQQQPFPVIAYGTAGPAQTADVLVDDRAAARVLEERIAAFPLTALTLVQVLRTTELLPVPLALDVESMAYSTLQSGPEFAHWHKAYQSQGVANSDPGAAIAVQRHGDRVSAVLNRPQQRNAISIEMRDALVEVLQVLEADSSIEALEISANGACFSVGGELEEFGSLPDPATAHRIRAIHSPARLMASQGLRVTCYVHGACIGSGLELPAFAARVVARGKTFFQLPELQLGLIPGAGGTVSIARRIGRQRTAWMVLSGRRINAQTALEWGLIDAIED